VGEGVLHTIHCSQLSSVGALSLSKSVINVLPKKSPLTRLIILHYRLSLLLTTPWTWIVGYVINSSDILDHFWSSYYKRNHPFLCPMYSVPTILSTIMHDWFTICSNFKCNLIIFLQMSKWITVNVLLWKKH